MRVLLVDPPFQIFMGYYRFYYPLGLGYIAAVLLKNGHETRIFDAEHSPECRSQDWLEASRNYHLYLEALNNKNLPAWQYFRAVLRDFRPDLVGISVLSVKVPVALTLASICKDFDSNIRVVVGGDHPTVLPQDMLKSSDVDFAVNGEGEYTMLELIEALEKGRTDFDRIDGLTYKQNGKMIRNNAREPIDKLDELPFPAVESIIGFESYRPIDLGIMMTCRGCSYLCTHCGIVNTSGRLVRSRSAGNIISEMKKLHQQYGVRYFSFRDATFTFERRRILELCDQIHLNHIDAQWECLTRMNFLDDELIIKMKDSGCVMVRVGIESGNEQLLKRMKRGISLNKIKQGARMLNNNGMRWSAYFMFGVPGETRQTIEDSLKLISEIDPPFVTVSNYSLIPGTEMYEEVRRLGLISDNIDWAQESNQNLLKCYSKDIDHQEFSRVMEQVGEMVRKRNEVQSGLRQGDFRDKL